MTLFSLPRHSYRFWKFPLLHCCFWSLIHHLCKRDVNEWSMCWRPWSSANSPGSSTAALKKPVILEHFNRLSVCECVFVCASAYLCVCLCMYFILLAPANLLTPDGEQWVSRFYFLLDSILIDRHATLCRVKTERPPPPTPPLPWLRAQQLLM